MSSEPDGAETALSPASEPEAKPARTLGPLRMIWRETAKYPRQVGIALLALLTTSTATIAIPARFKVIVDQAFGPGANAQTIATSFHYLLMIVVVLGLATALRFYFVSWLGERVVGDIRFRVQSNLLRLPPAFSRLTAPRKSRRG